MTQHTCPCTDDQSRLNWTLLTTCQGGCVLSEPDADK